MGDRAAGSKRRRLPQPESRHQPERRRGAVPFQLLRGRLLRHDFETEFGSYYEANANEMNNTEVPVEKGEKITGDITPPHPETPREQKFLEEFERKLRDSPRRRFRHHRQGIRVHRPKCRASSKSPPGCRVRSRS